MHSALGSVFELLDRTLCDYQDLWLPQPFTCGELPWCGTHGQLRAALLALDEREFLQLHNCPERRLRWFREREPDLCAALYAYEPALSGSVRALEVDSFDNLHIPGRKWQQILAFAGALPHRELPHVDWCAGKGHLSRIVQRNQRQMVHCLEWDASLVAMGEALAKRQGRNITYHHHNVLQPLPAECAETARVHIGLHACGDLHQRLLHHVVRSGATAVALSPCCYHKTSADLYLPLSGAARKTRLRLTRSALHLAVQGAATARRGERQLRERERLWRLGFDALQRDLRGRDDYLNVPSCKRELLRQGFPEFCQWAARRRQLALPDRIPYEHYLRLGSARHRDIVRLELLRQLFTRPLELWLVLDCALYLEEQGYRVGVTQFCERAVSPRNLLIQAERE